MPTNDFELTVPDLYHQKGFQQKRSIETVCYSKLEAHAKTNEMIAMRTKSLYNLKIIVLCCTKKLVISFILFHQGQLRFGSENGYQGNLTFCTNGTSYEADQTFMAASWEIKRLQVGNG